MFVLSPWFFLHDPNVVSASSFFFISFCLVTRVGLSVCLHAASYAPQFRLVCK